jgi:hypothetical protein
MMTYELKDVLKMLRVYHGVESEAEKFLTVSSFAMKNKEYKEKCAESTLKAIEEYKKLPIELRKEIEKDPSTNVSKIIEIEKMCRDAIGKKLYYSNANE